MLFDYHTMFTLPVTGKGLNAFLVVPAQAAGIVLFSFGIGSHDFGIYQEEECAMLHRKGLGTMLFDPLTEKEAMQYHNRFNFELLADRLLTVTKWLRDHKASKGQRIGYFGAGAGAAAALVAASELPIASALVCRDGKLIPPNEALSRVKTPTLLIAGASDEPSLDVQQKIYEQLTCRKKLLVIPEAGRNYEITEKGEEMRLEAVDWFSRHLQHAGRSKQHP